MQLIPALDLLEDDAVRLARGDFDRVIFRRPIHEVLERILETGPDLVHIVDLQGARDGEPRWRVLDQCVELCGSTPIQYSGGLRSTSMAREAVNRGAARVIVGTAAWEEPTAMSEFVDALGERLVVAVDIRDGRLATRGWLTGEGPSVDEAIEKCVGAGAPRLHVTAIDRDGTMSGPDIALYERACASEIPVVAAGGVRDDADVDRLAAVGCEAAIMGVGFLRRLGYLISG